MIEHVWLPLTATIYVEIFFNLHNSRLLGALWERRIFPLAVGLMVKLFTEMKYKGNREELEKEDT